MNSNLFRQKTPLEILDDIRTRIVCRRKNLKISQIRLAQKSGVSLGSIKRFETLHEISLSSLVKIAIALGLENDFDSLFTAKGYSSIDEVINEQL